jgi:hypothetical protein
VCTLLIGDASVLSATYLAVSFHDSQLIIGLVTLGVAAFAYLGALVCAAIRGIFFEDYVIRAFQNLRHASDFARSQRDLLLSEHAAALANATARAAAAAVAAGTVSGELEADPSFRDVAIDSELGQVLTRLGGKQARLQAALTAALLEREMTMRDALLLIQKRRTPWLILRLALRQLCGLRL